jgi:CYTH domain-containing protein
MGIEIERKFLVVHDSWKSIAGEGLFCRQGYLCSGDGKTVRVRVMGEHAFLTIKGPTNGISRAEFEYGIPVADAECLFTLCGNLVEKTRYIVTHAGQAWELDVFSGMNAGLVVAEIELESEQQEIDVPDWLGREVSGDTRYYNASLSVHPFMLWS